MSGLELNILISISYLLYFGILIVGAIVCFKKRFYMILTFFILMMLHPILEESSGRLLRYYIENEANLPISYGDYAIIRLMALRLFEFAAFLVLVLGLYRLWKPQT